MKALITGGAGQLGHDLADLLGPDSALPLTHAELDIDDEAAIERVFAEVEPDVVFNCAAFHNVDECETEADEGLGDQRPRRPQPGACRASRSSTSRPTTSSTGSATSPTRRTHPPSPRSVYALTKLAGEYAALAYGTRPLVVRAAGLYGTQGNASKGGNFVQRVLGRAREQGELKMVADQRLQPTFTVDLAAALVEAVEAGAEGVLHLTAGGECSWLEFTEAIVELAGDLGPDRGGRDDGPGGRRGAAAERRPRPAAGGRPRADAAARLARGARGLHGEGRPGRHRNRVRKAR